MAEGVGQPPDSRKTATFPQLDGALVGCDDEVELHGAETARPRCVERMHAHGECYAAAGCIGSGDVTAIGDVRAAAALIRLQIIGADNRAVVFGDEEFMLRRAPIGQRLVPAPVARQSISLAY